MKKITEKILHRGRWLLLKEDTFVNADNKRIIWETVERTNNSLSFGIIAKLIPSNRYVLIKQFRQPINNFVLGLPAGVSGPDISSQEELDRCILKELKEETGYTGKIKSQSPKLKLNPAMINHDFIIIEAEIDERDPKNINVEQALEPAEEIEVILIKKEKINDLLSELGRQGVAIGSGIWFLAHNLS
ncbi:MAG TPA: NUDIX hydrolase [Candidatus Omnitrophota bacterium]|nr:NUDIX hydrolase [Candidatus Omnitrophota bacterium]